MTKVFLAIPSMGTVSDSQVAFLRDIEKTYKGLVEIVYPDVLCRRMFHDYARNMMVEDFLKSECDVMWFLDSDVTPSKNILDLITLHLDKWKVAGACYPIFMTPPGQDLAQIMFTA